MMKIAFYKGKGSLQNAVIRFWQRGPYSHCEAVLSGPDQNGLYEIASSEPGIGVRTTRKALPDSDWDFVDVPADAEKVRKWFIENDGAKYDYLGLLGFVIRPIRSEGRWYFCSEAIGDALGVVDAWRQDPNSFWSMLTYKAA